MMWLSVVPTENIKLSLPGGDGGDSGDGGGDVAAAPLFLIVMLSSSNSTLLYICLSLVVFDCSCYGTV